MVVVVPSVALLSSGSTSVSAGCSGNYSRSTSISTSRRKSRSRLSRIGIRRRGRRSRSSRSSSSARRRHRRRSHQEEVDGEVPANMSRSSRWRISRSRSRHGLTCHVGAADRSRSMTRRRRRRRGGAVRTKKVYE